MHSVTSNAVNEALKNGMYVGSCVIWNEPVQLTGTQDITVLGSYSYGLIDFINVNVPIGFHLEYTISAQVTTGGNAHAYVKINNIGTGGRLTWSAPSFRVISASQRFRKTDIVLEPTFQYTATLGTNLHLCSLDLSGDNNTVSTIYGVTLTCFLVKD